jgi:hypothetical protein
MFKKSHKEPQLDFFASVPSMLESSASKQYGIVGCISNKPDRACTGGR